MADNGLQIGIERGRRGALELADLGEDFVGRGDVGIRPDGAHGRDGAALVLRVGVGIDEHDRERLGAGLEQILGGGRHLGHINARADAAVRERALADFQPPVARHHRLEPAPQAPGLRPVAPAHFQHVAKARGGDEAGHCAGALDQRVGADRGAVHHRRDRAEIGGHGADAVEHALGRIVPRGRHLADRAGAARLVEGEHVGERAADVDADD